MVIKVCLPPHHIPQAASTELLIVCLCAWFVSRGADRRAYRDGLYCSASSCWLCGLCCILPAHAVTANTAPRPCANATVCCSVTRSHCHTVCSPQHCPHAPLVRFLQAPCAWLLQWVVLGAAWQWTSVQAIGGVALVAAALAVVTLRHRRSRQGGHYERVGASQQPRTR